MKYRFLPLVLFFLFSFTTTSKVGPFSSKIGNAPNTVKEIEAESLYHKLRANQFSLPTLDSFSEAITGFYQLKEKGLVERDILTIIDFSLSSNTKRMWVIDMAAQVVLMNSYVAHGKNTGEEFAKSFSNENSSFKSSLGFYTTGEIYNGKHGMSLKLDGLEKGINDKARERGIVMHAADYVSNDFIKSNKRLGRSQGCPAVPVELSSEIIDMIKGKSCLFMYHPSRTYMGDRKVTL
ncbi:MAG: murein L,D-transpeptidase catalytic domain family protein [Flavobacterium sp.]|nr:murein L,D-transpeptidase catalytic domain family protein [Flavobacterium sp.]